jgi:carboxymethylenebutenolidase
VESIRDVLSPQDTVTFETYEADHAFDNDDFHLYDADSSATAWSRTEAWLAEHLPV